MYSSMARRALSAAVFRSRFTRLVGRRRKCQRQVAREQIGRAAKHHDRALDEHARRVLQVLARRREQLRHRRQLGRRLARPRLGRRRLHRHQVVDARGDRRRVDHRVLRPGANRVEVEQPAVDDALEDAAIDALVGGQRRGIERVEPAAKRAQPARPRPRSPPRRNPRASRRASGCRCRRRSTDAVWRTDRGTRQPAPRTPAPIWPPEAPARGCRRHSSRLRRASPPRG